MREDKDAYLSIARRQCEENVLRTISVSQPLRDSAACTTGGLSGWNIRLAGPPAAFISGPGTASFCCVAIPVHPRRLWLAALFFCQETMLLSSFPSTSFCEYGTINACLL